MTNGTRHNREPLVHLSRRMGVSQSRAWVVRIVAFVLSILVCALATMALSENAGFVFFFRYFFKGVFGSPRLIWNMLRDMAVLLLLALAVTPCFKMRYWNIGGEGQVLMGCLGSAIIVRYLYGKMPTPLLILVALAVAIVFGIVWAVVPALFKAKWNTNETLLTLMFNYVAGCLGAYFVKKADPNTTGSMTFLSTIGEVGKIGSTSFSGRQFLSIILIALFVAGFMFIYLKYSKHGYEIAVVGESPNTARYVGIHNKKVIIRTLILCGLLCGLAGFLLVCFKDHSFKAETATETTVGGLGFTAVLVSWLAQFNPFAMILTALLVAFISRGSANVGNYARLGGNYPNMMVGIFFFFIIATEFFINFKITFRSHAEVPREPDDLPEPPAQEEQEAGTAVADTANAQA